MYYDSFDTWRVIWIFYNEMRNQKDRSWFGFSDLNMHLISDGEKCRRKFMSWLSCVWEKIEGREEYYFKRNLHMPI